MLLTKRAFIFTISALIIILSCKLQQHDKSEVELAMKQYDHLIEKMDMDSIALLYTPDGDLGTVAHGRDSIRKFLAGFKSMKVLSQISTTDSTIITGDTARQTGFYHQTVIVSANDTVRVKGAYNATWFWVPQNGWLIKKMETKPVQ